VTRPDEHRAHPHDPDADRLSAAWNDLVAGRQPIERDELTDAVQSLHAGAPNHQPTSAFKEELRENLMHATVPIEMAGLRQPPRLREQAADPRSRVPSILGGRAVRWTAIAATVALLLTTLAAGYLGGLYPSVNKPEPTGLAALYTGTPAAGTPAADPCIAALPYVPCGYVAGMIGSAMIMPANLPNDALQVSRVQLQGWEVPGTATVTFTDSHNPVTGVAVDIVVGGAYLAEFSAPVVIARPSPEGTIFYQYPEADSAVELSRGDSVTYEIGTRREVKNRFGATTLQFKTVLFYEGDASPDNALGGGQHQSEVEGDGPLPKALSDYSDGEIGVWLTYAHVPKGDSLSPQVLNMSAVLGPVGNIEAQDNPNDGFVVWLSASRG
jgi:hypothetical protein